MSLQARSPKGGNAGSNGKNSLNNRWDISSGKVHNGGHNKKPREELVLCLQEIPLSSRRTYRDAGAALGISPRLVHAMLHQEKTLRRHSSSLKPIMTNENKVKRLQFCLEQIDVNSGLYKQMLDSVQVDEKWFEITENSVSYILTTEEKEPEREGEKLHKPRIMFLCAVAKPRYDPHRKAMWDGKIGMWPIAELVPAKRTSKNRERGTLEWKPVSVNKDVYRSFIC